jgi:hypothetical protein
MKIDPDSTVAIREFQAPHNVKQVSRFIGMVSYFAKFIKDYAKILAP